MLKKSLAKVPAPTLLTWTLATVFAVSLIYGTTLLVALLAFEMHPIHHGGAGLIYTAVGRGILNGLLPYRDLFEFKPPGIFLISAASLRLTGDIRGANILQGLCYPAFIALLLVPFFRELKSKAWSADAKLSLLGAATAIIALLSAFYLSERAGQFQTESFGTVFVVAYAIAVRKTSRPLPLFVGGVLLAIAIGIKESFLLVAFSMALVMFPLRSLPRTFIVPLLIGAVTGIAALFAFGYFEPYISIYIPELLEGRSSYNPFPAWVLAFDAAYVVPDLWKFSPALTISGGLVWLSALLEMTKGWKNPRIQAALAVILASSVALYMTAAKAVIGLQKLQQTFDQTPLPTDPLFWPVTLGSSIFVLAVWIGLHRGFERAEARRIFYAWAACTGALLIVFITILAQGSYPQHFALLVPLLAALLLRGTESIMEENDILSSQWMYLFAAAVIASIGIFLLAEKDYDALIAAQTRADSQARSEAAQIDNLMDACGYDRYVVFGTGDGVVPFAYTRHSPAGPGFFRISDTFPVAWRKAPIPYLQETFKERFRTADFLIAHRVVVDGKILIDGTDIPEDVWSELSKYFVTAPPPCAAPFPPISGMLFIFRAP